MTIVEALGIINDLGREHFDIGPVMDIAVLGMHDGEKFTGKEFCQLRLNGEEIGPQFDPKEAEQVVTFFLLGVRFAENGA